MRVAINGFGRIGKLVFRAFLEKKIRGVDVVAINELGSLDSSYHLLKFDSTHGQLTENIIKTKDSIKHNNKNILFYSEKDPTKLPWKKLKIDIVLECSGVFASKEKSYSHIIAGAKKVIISAPAKGVDATIVQGVNNQILNKKHQIISNGSCTTNCLAPVAMIMDKHLGIESGFMTTIHSFTGDQRTIDQAHKDLRRARTASSSLIPTSTGAAQAVGEVLPELKDRLSGVAVRVPTSNVSMIDLTFSSKYSTTTAEVNESMRNASTNGKLKNVLSFTDEKLVSTDFYHNPHSSIFHTDQTFVTGSKLVRILSWYDNEWGFSNRMADTAVEISKHL